MAKKTRRPLKPAIVTIGPGKESKELRVVDAHKFPAWPMSYVPQVVSSQGEKAQKQFVTFFTDNRLELLTAKSNEQLAKQRASLDAEHQIHTQELEAKFVERQKKTRRRTCSAASSTQKAKGRT